VLPGLGQLFNRRRRLTLLFLIPTLVVVGVAALLIATQSPARLTAWLVGPAVLGTLLTLNLMILAWRLVAAGQAFLDTRWAGPTSRWGVGGIVAIAVLVALPHVAIHQAGTALDQTFARILTPGDGATAGVTSPPRTRLEERVNVLLLGVDTTRTRATALTDTMIVGSLDPVGGTVSLVAIPRDIVNIPLGNGDVYGPKLNSLMSYADAHPDEFPDGGVEALKGALGTLLGIPIHYHAVIRFDGLIAMVDAVGGIEVTVKDGFADPTYDGYGFEGRGFAIEAGTHHLDGASALAFARTRKAPGESDFTRAGRQLQIIVAMRDAVTADGSVLWELPALLDAVGDTIRTDVPTELLPDVAAIIEEIDEDDVARAVIRHPLVKSKTTRYGSSLVPNLDRILAMAGALFPRPGTDPIPWPTPKPTATPDPAATSEPRTTSP
jgi:polyisoprenyl-teichoic acid--peptidoglycan teichoic acid transferase